MFTRLVARLQNVTKLQRRTISEYAKSFGYKIPISSGIPEPSIKPLKILLCYGGAAILLYDVVQDRRTHYSVFISQREEGREYLRVQPNFNFFTPLSYPPLDRYLNKKVPELDIKDPGFSSAVKDGMAHMTLKDDPNEWKEDKTNYIK